MRAEQEKERIEKAQGVLARLADGQRHRVLDLWQGGPVVEWQLRFLKRLQRESMVIQQGDGFQATGRMVPLLQAASSSVPAVVELLWPERTKDVLKGLAQLASVALPEPEAEPAPSAANFDADDTNLFRGAVVAWILEREPGRWYRVKDLLPVMNDAALFPRGTTVWEQRIMLGQLLSNGSRRLDVVEDCVVERRNGHGGMEYRLIEKAPTLPVAVATPPTPVPAPPPPQPQHEDLIVLPALAPEPFKSIDAVVAALREHGPLPKRELQDRIGGKRQNAAGAIDTALAEGVCFFGHVPGHVRARMYLQEQLEAAEAEHASVPQDADGRETADAAPVATATDTDMVDDETFKAMVLKYTLIYGQNFITIGEHLRVLHETVALLHEKIDALLEKKA